MSILFQERGTPVNDVKTSKYQAAIVDHLIYLPLFDGLKGNELKAIAQSMNIFEIAQGEILFKEGDKGDYVCFVVDGAMDIIKESPPKGSVVIASLSKGRSIGEMAIIDKFPRSASVRARTKVTYITLTQKGFDTILKNYPEIGIKILKGISRLLSLNLRRTSSQLAEYMLPVS